MIWRFGEFDVDVALFQLRRADVPVKLERLVFDLMLYLIEERRRVALRHELIARLWPHETVVPTGLARVVSTLRTALDDDALRPRYIETIRGRGYRFIHPVQGLSVRVPDDLVLDTQTSGASWTMTIDGIGRAYLPSGSASPGG